MCELSSLLHLFPSLLAHRLPLPFRASSPLLIKSEHLARALHHVLEVALGLHIRSFAAGSSFSTQSLVALELFFDAHLLLVNHEKGVKQHAESE